MNPKLYMVIDLEEPKGKKKFITEKVSSIHPMKNSWKVQFISSYKVFNYNKYRLLYLTQPEIISLDEKGLFIKNKRIHDVKELRRFSNGTYTYYHIEYSNGYTECLDENRVYVTRTAIDQNDGGVWEYLKKMAQETGLLVAEDQNLLSRQYNFIDVKRDNVPLAQYIGNKSSLKTYKQPKTILYPFGCNASQQQAVAQALTNQVSIIQGPPGTGKTQTILNIIANLLLQKKTVLVVSNNNSAVDNVFDKLNDRGLGFIVAKLGNSQNRDEFISKQTYDPNLSQWHIENEKIEFTKAAEALKNVSQGFDDQLRNAQLHKEYDSLLTEIRYDKMMQDDDIILPQWLSKKSSIKLMALLNLIQRKTTQKDTLDFWTRIKCCITYGSHSYKFLNKDNIAKAVYILERAYYYSRKNEIETELADIDARLKALDINDWMNKLTTASMLAWKSKTAKRYEKIEKSIFSKKDLKKRTEAFLAQYPVVLSTTYSAKECIDPDMVFDYVIMDEASQVDIKTGALALSCATNAVIVGDDKQLPNVVTNDEAVVLNAIQAAFGVDDKYNAVTHSFLKSCQEVFPEAPVTLLREHYRCHPKIIEFCNQRFYNGELIAMTPDNSEANVLQVIQTVKGNHARNHFNQREIDVIQQEIIPQFSNLENLGIITPYKNQAEEINRCLGRNIASTVHKYQGRECDAIILSMVDNEISNFSDDANLLNVAISRAKNKIFVVSTGNGLPPHSNIAQFIEYIKYNNFSVTESGLHSVFDILYKQYTTERLAYASKTHLESEHLSESLVYEIVSTAITELNLSNIDVISQYPLRRLVRCWERLTDEEREFAEKIGSHVDFLIYNSLTKQPLKIIEVDGWRYHNGSIVQKHRDAIKDALLSKFELTPHRIRTTDILTVETMKSWLSHALPLYI